MSKYWQKLENLANELSNHRIENLQNERHFQRSFFSFGGLSIDTSKNRISEEVRSTLLALADESGLTQQREAMFAGEAINVTENRQVLHTLLRANENSQQASLDEFAQMLVQRKQSSAFAEKIREGQLIGATGKPISTIINIGIGGSDLGPQLVIDAFKHNIPKSLSIHFMSDVDYAESSALLDSIDLETSLFILCSKSFTTWETQTNAQLAIHALKEKVGDKWPRHFAGVAVNQQAMTDFGILPEHQFLIWDWVGGRYSVWSSIGLICRIALGNDIFEAFLNGASEMDEHFLNEDFETNLPVNLALTQIWNSNFQNHHVFVTLPYRNALRLFPDYQQQLEMESNGKRVDVEGNPLDYSTCPYIFGQLGLNAQHAFMQLIHQSEMNSYVEFIAVPEKDVPFEKDVAFRSCLAQSRALMTGTKETDSNHKVCSGDRPSSVILLDEMTPNRLGKLIALYEHKVFVQSVIWKINAFDQFGVELGKKIANQLNHDSDDVDYATKALIRRFSKAD